ncbi:unnamed protein product [Alopecurus aequalis]
MATVLDALARYVVHMLAQLATDEVRMMLGVSGEIDKMGEKLLDLKNILADADRRNITDDSVREWVGQLKRAMYQATDILDLCQLKAMEQGSSSIDAGCFNPLLFCMRNPSHAHDIGARLKALNKRLDNIKERSSAFNFINLGSYEDRRTSMVHASRHVNPSRETSGELDRSGVVGNKIEEDTRALVAQILQTRKEVNDNITVVAIVGVGGIGKTTLAQKVFNDEAVQGEFSKKIWLSVNQNFNEAELLKRVIVEARGDHQSVGDSKVALHRTLKDALIGHKILLVMDDVWDHGAWEGALKIPLVNAAASGSRVLITTRNEGVARGLRATWPYHHVDTLGPDDAWLLLKKQVLSSEIDEDNISMLKDIGLKIIEKCGGLPLAVKVMGGLLRRKGELRRDWEQVLGDSKWSITEMPQELNHAVYLSYEDMPPYLKQCFLYYSLLPKNRKFNVDQVVAMWISEGFVYGDSNDLEELGENYYKELISRNLIEPDKLYIDQVLCSMHDVVRSFAHYMTKDEAFVAHNEDKDIFTRLSSQKFLRLSIETDRSQSGELEWKSLKEQQSVRTLISNIQFKTKPGDSLATYSSLRTLHIESADVAALFESLHKLKHLRYLTLVDIGISVLPGNIGKMKLLQFLDLYGCKKLVNLPGSIVKLGQLRLLRLANISMIPRGFHGLTNMRKLVGFQAHMDGDWCSLDELGPLSELKVLVLHKLENVSTASFATSAMLGQKIHLLELALSCTSRLGGDGLVKEKMGSLRRSNNELRSWMMSTSMVPLNNLKNLMLSNLACCTQLPTGLCQLPYLQDLQVHRAPCIRHVGTAFLQAVATPFPRLNQMILAHMVEWEEWEWEEQVQAMPCMKRLFLDNCKLRRVPPGFASNARSLKLLYLKDVQHISFLENFPFVVELTVLGSPDLERITDFPSLQKLTITNCPKLKVLESIPILEKLVLKDYAMEILPEYLRGITARNLELLCRLWLLASLAVGQSGTEWDKFSHVEHVKAYAGDKNNTRKWYVLYTRDNCKLDSNISRSKVFEETLSSCMVDAQGFEHAYKMRRSTLSYVCSLVRIPFLEHTIERDQTFVDGRAMSLQDLVALALVMLNSGKPPEIIGSSIGVDESTASLVTQRFVEALCEQAGLHHARWPHSSSEMEKIKHNFDKMHDLPNCCGVVHTSRIKFGLQSDDHEHNDGILLQTIVDPHMRFTDIWLDQSGSMNQCSILESSMLFKQCEKGMTLNGSKLKVSSGGGGSDVGEYIIGDAGYPLRPWLLTPYQLEGDLSDSDYKKEFNRRHSAATTVAQRALARLKDTWKCLQGQGWHPKNQREMVVTIGTCCLLHNIVIDMEEEGAGMPSDWEHHKIDHVRQIADEDAVRVRDVLSQHLIKYGAAHTVASGEEQGAVPVASGSGDEIMDQEAFP